jgi:hypothetical protein
MRRTAAGHEWSGGLKNVVPKERAIRTGVPTASRRIDDDDAAGHPRGMK